MLRVVVVGFANRQQRVAFVVAGNNYNTPVVQGRIVLVHLHRTRNRRIHCPFVPDIVRMGIRKSPWIA